MKHLVSVFVTGAVISFAAVPHKAVSQDVTVPRGWQLSVSAEYIGLGDGWFLNGPNVGVRTSIGYAFNSSWTARVGVGVGHHYVACDFPNALFGNPSGCSGTVLPNITTEVLHIPRLSKRMAGILGGRAGIFGSPGDIWLGGGARLGLHLNVSRHLAIEGGVTGDVVHRWASRSWSPWTTRTSVFLGTAIVGL